MTLHLLQAAQLPAQALQEIREMVLSDSRMKSI